MKGLVKKEGILKTITFAGIMGAIALYAGGCQTMESSVGKAAAAPVRPEVIKGFAPSRIEVIGLTGIVREDASQRNEARLNAYIDLLDVYDCRVKYPGRFRLELYEYVPRSSDPRGDRLILWPDIDLRDASMNNSYWQDYLRTYKFRLDIDFQPRQGQVFILEATFITPGGRQLTDRYRIQTG